MISASRSRLVDVLDERLGLSEDDVTDWVEATLAGSAVPGSSPISSTELDYLAEHGGEGVAESLASWSPETARRDQGRIAFESLTRIVHSSVTITEASLRLGVSRSRVSHRIAAKTLWSVRIGTTRHIPAWQFVAVGQLLPGLTDVVRAIPDGASPETVEALMREPQDDLGGETPISHLLNHGDPAPVCELLADLDRW